MSPATITAPLAILINDRTHFFAAEAAVLAAVQRLGIEDRRGVAVAVNGVVVPRTEWAARPLAVNDRLIVIQATQGG